MASGKLLLVPSGGLANRMRAIASAVNLCAETGSSLDIVWFRDWALGAPFGDIFKPLESSAVSDLYSTEHLSAPEISLREARRADFLLYDRARQRNLWLPRLPQRVLFDACIEEKQVTPLKQKGFDFEAWARARNCYMSCYQVFGTLPDGLLARLFRPVDEVTERVEANLRLLGPSPIGMHVRRGDHKEAAEASPLHLFISRAREEIERNPDTRIFLATDGDDVKAALGKAFGDRIVTSPATAVRDSTAGIRDALADMYTLARTRHIYGSAISTFSPMAAAIGGIPFTTVATDFNP